MMRFAVLAALLISIAGCSASSKRKAASMNVYTAGGNGPVAASASSVPLVESRGGLRDAWISVLGSFPERPPLDATVISEEKETGYTRYHVRYQTELSDYTEAFLLVPDAAIKSPAPAAVVFHATSGNHMYQPVGLADDPTRHLALYLTQRGFVTLSPRNYIYGFGGGETIPDSTQRFLDVYPEWTGMGKMLWDGIRAVDYLETRPEADTSRIAAAGHSLGAKEVVYLMAFDSRVKAGISSEGGIGFDFTNWDAPWYLGDQINQPGFPRHHGELLALAAPRALMILGGGESDGRFSWPYIQSAAPVYTKHGAADNLALMVHDAGHDIPPDARERAFDWLVEKLNGQAYSNLK